ncbi:MAG: hypothetical protein ACI9W4_001232 [Rhodothermales bacterium]|jgi:hypothetical protein
MKRSSIEMDIVVAFLDETARQALEADIGDDADRAQTVAESYRLKGVLEGGGALEARELDDLLLAFSTLGEGHAAHTWRARISEKLEGDPEAAGRAEDLRRQVADLEAGSDAAAHFARLTGHAAAPGPSRRGLWLAAASVVVLVLAHGLYESVVENPARRAAWSQLDRPRPTRSAAFAATELQRANEMAIVSRRTVFGLWPRYDQARLLEADAMLTGRDDPPAVLLRARIQATAGQFERSRGTLDAAAQAPEPASWRALRQALAPDSLR